MPHARKQSKHVMNSLDIRRRIDENNQVTVTIPNKVSEVKRWIMFDGDPFMNDVITLL